MSDSARISVPPSLLQWLAEHTRFPASRLPAPAETLLCVAAAAALDSPTAGASGHPLSFGLQRREGEKESALRAHALRRSRAHFKCDNSAKV